jgi:hypothetical protein
MKLTMQNVQAVIMAVLYTDAELAAAGGAAPAGYIAAEGITTKFGFHPERLEAHRADVRSMLMQLPEAFMKSKGGGMTFLNACNTREGHQWGEHRDMETLFALGMGLGYVSYPMPREMWSVLPGGMPYITVDDTRDERLAEAKEGEE